MHGPLNVKKQINQFNLLQIVQKYMIFFIILHSKLPQEISQLQNISPENARDGAANCSA